MAGAAAAAVGDLDVDTVSFLAGAGGVAGLFGTAEAAGLRAGTAPRVAVLAADLADALAGGRGTGFGTALATALGDCFGAVLATCLSVGCRTKGWSERTDTPEAFICPTSLVSVRPAGTLRVRCGRLTGTPPVTAMRPITAIWN